MDKTECSLGTLQPDGRSQDAGLNVGAFWAG